MFNGYFKEIRTMEPIGKKAWNFFQAFVFPWWSQRGSNPCFRRESASEGFFYGLVLVDIYLLTV
jgi:hypothetical protein